MKVIGRVVMFGPDIEWPEGWPPPRVGDHIAVGDDPDEATVHRVEHVEWDPARGTVYFRAGSA